MRLAPLLSLGPVLVGLLLTTPGHARPIPPVAAAKRMSMADRAAAKKAFEEATAAYTEADYEKALEKFEEAYELSEKPLIWDSIAKCHEKLGQFQEAYDALSKWREAAPRNEHQLLDKRLEKLKGRAEAKQKEEAEKQRQLDEAKREAEEAKRKAAAAEKAAKDRPATAAPEEETDLLLPGIIVASVGGAALLTGVVVAAVGAGQRPDAEEACRDVGDRSLCRESDKDDIEGSATLTTVGDILWIAGAVTTAVGGSLIVIDLLGDDGDGDAGVKDAHLRLGPGAFMVEGRW